ncbi:SRPBCC family protein [Nocardia colli]|uniref:SRPBCC family protein n=1 Tax=Nocardia colli TaxID=2545717 RepID=A0A5N0EEF6_9NOCA|nr:SRPBCC family protein [Nocardia colli]KAA8887190.1 SRPBCC family protein [Nocardia colli]
MITVTREIAVPPEQVWSVITDLDRTAEVIRGITKLERVDSGTGFGVGTSWRETRVMLGKSATETMTVTAIVPGQSYTTEADSHGTHYRSIFTLTAKGNNTLLAMGFEGTPHGKVGRVAAFIGKLLEGPTRRMLRRDLDDIAAAAER